LFFFNIQIKISKEITVIVLYYVYVIQNRKSTSTKSITAKLFTYLLTTVRIDRIIDVDLHTKQKLLCEIR